MNRILAVLSALALLVSVGLAAPPRHGGREHRRGPEPGYHHPQGFTAFFNGCWFHWDNGQWREFPPGHQRGEHRGAWRPEPPRHHGWNHERGYERGRGHGRHNPPGRH